MAQQGRPIYLGGLAADLQERLGVSAHFARDILSAVFASIGSHLVAGRRVDVRGFGEFKLKRVGAKTMRVGFKGSKLHRVEAHLVPGWKPSQSLKDRVRPVRAGGADAP